MNSLMDGDQRLAHPGAKTSRPRHLHQSTLHLGDAAPCYTTTHSQSYSGRATDGRPLIFQLRDPSCPSQHQTQLDLSDSTTLLPCPLQSHTKEVHRPQHTQHTPPRADRRAENWARYRSGQAVREITNPQDPSEYRTTYHSEHTLPAPDGSAHLAGGRPTQWHQHDILTGEQRAGPEKSSRRTRDQLLWAARRWETDCSALRLY